MAHQVVLIFISIAVSQTSAYTARPRIRASVSRCVSVSSLAFTGTHCAYPRRDGQVELTWVAGCIPWCNRRRRQSLGVHRIQNFAIRPDPDPCRILTCQILNRILLTWIWPWLLPTTEEKFQFTQGTDRLDTVAVHSGHWQTDTVAVHSRHWQTWHQDWDK